MPMQGKVCNPNAKLKVIDCLRATRWTTPDYWQTDNFNGLVMVIRNYHWLNSASQVLISTCSAPLGEHKQFSLFDLDLWLTTLTYNLRLAKVKVDPHAKNQGQRSKGSNRMALTDKRTDTRYQTYYRPCYAVDNHHMANQSTKFEVSSVSHSGDILGMEAENLNGSRDHNHVRFRDGLSTVGWD